VNTDTAGQERFRTITSSYYRGAQFIILCFDLTDISTLNACNGWMKEIEKYASDDIIIVAAGTRCDLVDQRVVNKQMIEEFFYRFSRSIPYFEVSARTGQGVEELFMTAAEMWLTKRTGGSDQNSANMNDNVERERVASSSNSEDVENKEKNCIIC